MYTLPASDDVTSHARRKMIASSDWMSRSCDSARPIEINISFSWRERSCSSSIVAAAMRSAIVSERAQREQQADHRDRTRQRGQIGIGRRRIDPALLEVGITSDNDQTVVT